MRERAWHGGRRVVSRPRAALETGTPWGQQTNVLVFLRCQSDAAGQAPCTIAESVSVFHSGQHKLDISTLSHLALCAPQFGVRPYFLHCATITASPALRIFIVASMQQEDRKVLQHMHRQS